MFSKLNGYYIYAGMLASIAAYSKIYLQVALGEIHFGVDSSVIRSGAQDKLARCDTLKVIGRQQPDPQYDMTMENGTLIMQNSDLCF